MNEQKYHQFNALFKFLVRPVTTLNVDADIFPIFERELFKIIENLEFSSNITGILIMPTIFDDSIAPPPAEYARHQKKDNSFTVGKKIDFREWQDANFSGKIEMLYENIKASVESIDSRYLNQKDKENLILSIKETENILKWKILN